MNASLFFMLLFAQPILVLCFEHGLSPVLVPKLAPASSISMFTLVGSDQGATARADRSISTAFPQWRSLGRHRYGLRWPETHCLMAEPNSAVDPDLAGGESLSPNVDFERQELRVIFDSMDKNNVFYKMLSEDQIVSIAFLLPLL